MNYLSKRVMLVALISSCAIPGVMQASQSVDFLNVLLLMTMREGAKTAAVEALNKTGKDLTLKVKGITLLNNNLLVRYAENIGFNILATRAIEKKRGAGYNAADACWDIGGGFAEVLIQEKIENSKYVQSFAKKLKNALPQAYPLIAAAAKGATLFGVKLAKSIVRSSVEQRELKLYPGENYMPRAGIVFYMDHSGIVPNATIN